DGAGARLLVDVPDDEAERHLEGSRKSNAALLALLDVVLRRLELIAHEFEPRTVGKILDREHGLEDFLQADAGPALRQNAHLQKLVVGGLLHLDEVRHRRDLGNAPEALANTLAARERLRHG